MSTRVEVKATLDEDVFESLKEMAELHTGGSIEAYIELQLLQALRPARFAEVTAGKFLAAA